MEIVWLGHACFRLRGKEATVVTDPYAKSLGIGMPRVTADIVTVSHDDPHHNHVAGVAGSPKVVDGPGEYEIGGVAITGVRTYRDKQKGATRGKNTSYLIHIDELKVCHLGDLGHLLSADQIDVLKEVDVLLLPVGGHCTIGASEAAEVISQLEPRIVIPMHYWVDGIAVPLDRLDKFLREMGIKDAQPQPRLSVTASNLPDEPTTVVLEMRS
ncbi:MAG TPA: MBL fold metallo-hydrolase [Chloroflexota bacterium]